MKSISLVVLVAVASACKGGHHEEADAASAAAPDAGVASADAGGADAAVVLTAAPSPTTPGATGAAPSTGHSAVTAVAAAGGPFQASYHCFTGGLRVSQNGERVSGVTGAGFNPKLANTVLSFSCAVSGDQCNGTGSQVVMKDGKSLSPKPETRSIAVHRLPDGTISVKFGNDTPTVCKRE